MPWPSRTQLILLEIGVAAAAVGYAYEGPWMAVGVGVGVVCLALALLPVRRRPLYLVVRSWIAMLWRRRGVRGTGVASLVGGELEVVTVPRGSGGVSVAAIRDETTWSVPLALPLVGVLNDDPPIPLDGLADLLLVEDVPMSSVRVVSLASPAAAGSGGPTAAAPVASLVSRYLVLTLDTSYAADVIAARGGGAAVQQILRRCVLRAEEVLNAAGVATRRLPAQEVSLLSANSLGPVAPAPDGSVPRVAERSDLVLLGGSASVTYAVSGNGAVAKLEQLAAGLRVPVVATSVDLQHGPPPQREPMVRYLVRLSGSAGAVKTAGRQLDGAARQHGLSVHRLVGDQVPVLRATTLLGVPAESA